MDLHATKRTYALFSVSMICVPYEKHRQRVNKVARVVDVVVLCVPASRAEVSHILGQGSSFGTEAGAAHPDGPPSQPHALHRCQVTNGNRLQPHAACAITLASLRFHLMRQPLSSDSRVKMKNRVFFFHIKCQVEAECFDMIL